MFMKIKTSNFLNTISKIITKHNNYQIESVPLCAAENIISEFCKLPLSSDWQERYIMGNTYSYSEKDNFIGSENLIPVYNEIHKICSDLFNCKYSDARTLSGMNCLTTLLMSITISDDKIALLPSKWGGHASVKPVCERLGLKIFELPYDIDNLDINYEEANIMLNKEGIKYILLAPSDIIHALDIRKFNLTNKYLLYDISQLMGLIAGKTINNPLDISDNVIIFGGTHKTLPGPASGLIMTNNEQIHSLIEKKINPLYLRHTQMHQVLSLLFALIEFNEYGEKYADKILHISNVLGRALEESNFEIIKIGTDVYSETHQIFIKCSQEQMELINKNAIIYGITLNKKEKELFQNTGIRLGTQEIARYDWSDEALDIIPLILKELTLEAPNSAKVECLKQQLPSKVVKFTFPDETVTKYYRILHKE